MQRRLRTDIDTERQTKYEWIVGVLETDRQTETDKQSQADKQMYSEAAKTEAVERQKHRKFLV